MLIFILQSIWLYIKELAGKDLDLSVTIKFIIYATPRITVLVVPLTILLSSIMVFGNFAENYEFAAMKSTGISLQRAMRSLSFFIVGLSVLMFFFANNVIPAAEFKFFNLRKNIAKVKPAMAIAEGQFNQISSLNIKVAKKSGDRGQFLEDVIIHQKKKNSQKNHTVIKSKRGELTSSENSDLLQLVLFDGFYYDELQPKTYHEREVKRPFIKSYFETYTLNVDLSNINKVDFENENVASKYSMLTITELSYTIDSLKVEKTKNYDNVATSMHNRSTISTLSLNINPQGEQKKEIDNIYELFSTEQNVKIATQANTFLSSTFQIINSQKKSLARKDKNLNKHIIFYYDKFAIGIACIILFFVGAPLGALIRKGGLGLPIVIAIVIFLTYHFIGIFAKNSAEDGSLSPSIAPWLSTFIMFPFSIYLTNRATKDRPLMSFDGILIPLKRVLGSKQKEVSVDNSTLEKTSDDYSKLLSYSDNKLIDIIKNYRQYDMDISFKNSSINILEERGITKQQLKYSGNLSNENYENALTLVNDYGSNSSVAFKLYFIYLFGIIVGAVLNNNGFPTLAIILIVIGILCSLFFNIFLFNSFNNIAKFYKFLDKKVNVYLLWVVGMPLYFLLYFYYKNKLKEDLKQVR